MKFPPPGFLRHPDYKGTINNATTHILRTLLFFSLYIPIWILSGGMEAQMCNVLFHPIILLRLFTHVHLPLKLDVKTALISFRVYRCSLVGFLCSTEVHLLISWYNRSSKLSLRFYRLKFSYHLHQHEVLTELCIHPFIQFRHPQFLEGLLVCWIQAAIQ